MKKVCFILLAVLLLALCGCKREASAPQTDSTTAATSAQTQTDPQDNGTNYVEFDSDDFVGGQEWD